MAAQEDIRMKMFGHRNKKYRDSEIVPGRPANDLDMPQGKARDNPPNYEGREHVKYKNPGYSKHDIRYPKDEPRMKSRVSRDEMHEMEDNYHMDVPDQTPDSLPSRIPRARMKMDAPDQQDPKPILGNPVHNVPYRGEEDTSGEEEMGPNYNQEEEGLPKEHRKKMAIAIIKRKMKRK